MIAPLTPPPSELRGRVYVAGPISDNPSYKEAFAAAAERLRGAGYSPFLPTELPTPSGLPGDTQWQAWMRLTTRALTRCAAVCLLPGWRDSRGALAEADWADTIGLPVHTLDEWTGAAR